MKKIAILLLFIINLISANSYLIEHDIGLVDITQNGTTDIVLYQGKQNTAFLVDEKGVPELPAYTYRILLPENTTIESFTIDGMDIRQLEGSYSIGITKGLWSQHSEEDRKKSWAHLPRLLHPH